MKINRHIEIVRTTRARYSSMGDKSAQKIKAALAEQYTHVGITIVNTNADLELLVRKNPDLVFLGLKKLPSIVPKDSGPVIDIWLPGYLDRAGIAYTGSAKAAIRLDFDKAAAKAIVHAAGLATAPFFTAVPGEYADVRSLPLQFPLFVKPLNTGGGNGVGDDSVVRSFVEFEQKVAAIAAAFDSSSLVEQYLTGREFSVALLENAENDEPSIMPIEIITQANARGDRILGSRVKHEDHEEVIAVQEPDIKAKVSALAKGVYDLLGARDLARIDIRLDAAGEAYFLEANFMPAPGSRYFTGACHINEGMDYQDVILAIAELGLNRSTQPERELLAVQIIEPHL